MFYSLVRIVFLCRLIHLIPVFLFLLANINHSQKAAFFVHKIKVSKTGL